MTSRMGNNKRIYELNDKITQLIDDYIAEVGGPLAFEKMVFEMLLLGRLLQTHADILLSTAKSNMNDNGNGGK